jgi:hypothetical protein
MAQPLTQVVLTKSRLGWIRTVVATLGRVWQREAQLQQ